VTASKAGATVADGDGASASGPASGPGDYRMDDSAAGRVGGVEARWDDCMRSPVPDLAHMSSSTEFRCDP